MRTVRIGVFDEEWEYVDRLSTYLNRKGAGRWSVSAYTDRELIEKEAAAGGLDLISGTDRQLLSHFRGQDKMPVLWLRETEKGTEKTGAIPSVCRYQGAALIVGAIERLLGTMLQAEKNKLAMIAVYSPVGRCGKTELSLQLAGQEQYGRWLYIGMEDYSFLWKGELEDSEIFFDQFDSFLYHIKERNEEQLSSLLAESQGVIPSAFSPFDTKCLEKEDFHWLLEWLQGAEGYGGVIFDIGTGVLSELSVLNEFDYVVVPFLKQEKSVKKLEQFKALLKVSGLEYLGNRLFFLDMDSEKERRQMIERIRGGGYEP